MLLVGLLRSNLFGCVVNYSLLCRPLAGSRGTRVYAFRSMSGSQAACGLATSSSHRPNGRMQIDLLVYYLKLTSNSLLYLIIH